jgi:hypothetical protein
MMKNQLCARRKKAMQVLTATDVERPIQRSRCNIIHVVNALPCKNSEKDKWSLQEKEANKCKEKQGA